MRIALLVSFLALAGCGSSDGSHSDAGEPISVQEAIDSGQAGVVLVSGYLIERGGELRLCEAILESYPPQCGEPSLRVEGTAPAASEKHVSLHGEVDDGTITISVVGQS